ncbi:hypothetical protein [Sphingomicrobium astaxanthinifaciens]|uniref:hypothetical protein n=1 Tax=Sphingomicrobium astaxanthinifaciens TaxID=1227949 RepID=UPI001FCC0E2A|nr:hypothetical protein [Sphingomicrobium astaxanthinifaciens]MCJ7421427.1 hypothetical protein [Sphingomicrobium astaxanthinifaciens]
MNDADDNDLHVEGSERSMVALIILFAAILLLLVFLFRSELGIEIPAVAVEVPAAVPDGAYSADDRPAR